MNKIGLLHGAGGRATWSLIKNLFVPRLGGPTTFEDAAELSINGSKLAFTTDSFVISPLFFSGGNIGKLAVYGTVNDLACRGAIPFALALSFIIEDGFPTESLEKVASAAGEATQEVGIKISCGDTKVVEQGKGDGLYITSTGIGVIPPDVEFSSERVKVGHKIIVSGTVGDHEAAIIAAREGFDEPAKSDLCSIYPLVAELPPNETIAIRDPTRGGLATVLNEIAEQQNVAIEIYEENIPLSAKTKVIAEILGLDPLYMASEGKAVMFVKPEKVGEILNNIRRTTLGENAQMVGEVVEGKGVWLKTSWSGKRKLLMLQGEQLPRIC